MSDGLTVPFALAAEISGAVSVNMVIVTAGLAEVATGSIAMGLGGYLAARSDAEHYTSELRREEEEVRDKPDAEKAEDAAVFTACGLTEEESAPLQERIKALLTDSALRPPCVPEMGRGWHWRMRMLAVMPMRTIWHASAS